MMTFVGDAYAAPLVEELARGSYDLSSLYAIGTGGAATNPKYQRALLEYSRSSQSSTVTVRRRPATWASATASVAGRRDTFVFREGGLVVSEDLHPVPAAG